MDQCFYLAITPPPILNTDRIVMMHIDVYGPSLMLNNISLGILIRAHWLIRLRYTKRQC